MRPLKSRPRSIPAIVSAAALVFCTVDCFAQRIVPSTGRPTPYRIRLTDVREYDGTNSGGVPQFGAAGIPLVRIAPAQYPGDASGEMILTSPDRANPRIVSNYVAAQGSHVLPSSVGMTNFLWAWGQFIDHDLDLTVADPANGTANIPIEEPDDPLGPGPIPFSRSNFAPATGVAGNPRQQINMITAYMDASNVYGSDASTAGSLRTFQGGLLSMSSGNLLPIDQSGMFLAGDVRVNENTVLTSMHTLFAREHNRVARLLALLDPEATDEELFQLTRKIISAEEQIITYQEFLPALLGSAAPNSVEMEFNPETDPSIATEFSTAFFRVGHTMLSSALTLAEDGQITGSVSLRDSFFNPVFLKDDPANVDRLLGGLALESCQEIDNLVIDDVRNFLFGPPGAGGMDLPALNIQRGRDHGLPDYNSLRAAYGLPRIDSFADVTSDPTLQETLQIVYGSVDNVDPWVGGLAEEPAPGTAVGPLVSASLRDQFLRVAAGDRFNYLNDVDLRQPIVKAAGPLAELTLANLIRRNTTVATLPDNVFRTGPLATSDLIATYDAMTNTIFIQGNDQPNSCLVVDTETLMMVMPFGNSRMNGGLGMLLPHRPKPTLIVDLGEDNDSLVLAAGNYEGIYLSLGSGDDRVTAVLTFARTVAIDPADGKDVIRPGWFGR